MFKKYILPRVVWIIYRTLYATWRIKIIEPPELKTLSRENKSFILAHWHGDELALLFLVRYFGLATMTSTSKDGNLINYVIHKFGGNTSRGSSTRGGARALKGLIRLIKQGWPTSIAVDGPRGPIHQVKPGVFELSRLTGAPIFSIGVSTDSKMISDKSWNKAMLPKPFAKLVVTFKPYKTFDKSMNPKDRSYAVELAENIHNANRHASNLFA